MLSSALPLRPTWFWMVSPGCTMDPYFVHSEGPWHLAKAQHYHLGVPTPLMAVIKILATGCCLLCFLPQGFSHCPITGTEYSVPII